MVKNNIKYYKIMFRLIKQVFIALLSFSGLLAIMANVSSFTTCSCLNNQPCMTRSTLLDIILVNIIKDCVTIHLWLA